MPDLSWIHEYPHPRVVVHFHPEGVPTLQQVRLALEQLVHAVELDLHFKPDSHGGGEVVCGHDAATADSPPLTDMIALINEHMGSHPTVQDDGRQFFLVLEPKANDTRLFDGIYQILSAMRGELSTAVRPEDGPRPITVVITGAYVVPCLGWLTGQRGGDVSHLMLGETIDYSNVITDLSGAKPPATFQWMTMPYDDAINGHVNALHLAQDPGFTGRFNARIWDTDSDEQFTQALAAGFDSVNCNAGRVLRFRQIMDKQQPRGRAPWLTARGSDALLVWQGDSTEQLYLAQGTLDRSGLRFARQLCLSTFHQNQPRGRTPSAALLPSGQLLTVYQGTNAERLWYLCGRFESADDISEFSRLAFSGRETELTLPEDAGRRGSFPAVAVSRDARVVVVFEGTDEQRLWYITGTVNPSGQFIGFEFELTEGNARRGHAPTVAFAPTGEVVVAYEGTDDQRLWYVSGTLDGAGRIVGQEHQLTQGSSRRGHTPCVAISPHGQVVVTYQGTGDQRLWYVSGRLTNGRIEGREFELTQGDHRRGSRPTIAFGDNGDAVLLYQGTDEGKIFYVHGQFDHEGRLTGEERLLDMSLNPV